MHRLLKRQIRKYLGEGDTPEDLQAFLQAVSDAYTQYDSDRKVLSRSMDLSSSELYEANQRLTEEAANQALVLRRLKNSLRSLQLTESEQDLADENVLSIVTLLQDQIDRRNAAEDALRERERKLQLILEASPDAIMLLDAAGQITSWNESASKTSGFSADEVMGQRPVAFVVEADVWEESLREAALTGYARTEGWRRRKDGGMFWAEATTTALRDDAGRLTGYVEIARDMTERRRDEEALRLTKEAAEAASHAKSEFLANMSHEIRTPMNAVIGMTGLLEDTDLSGDQRDMVQTIQSSGNALLSLINDILDLSKIEAGKLTFDAERFDFQACVATTLDVFRPLVNANSVRLNLRYQAGAPNWVTSDETRLRQVLFNLVGNAVKFTESGEISVAVSARAREGQVWYHVSVSDTGIGIDGAKLRSIFAPFSQVEDAYNRTKEGTGLGLAISKRLVEALGGEIWVDSKVGQGSTFHFTFVVPETEQESTRNADVKTDREPRRASFDIKVLVVEDNPTNQRVVCKLLERAGVFADVVENGLQAVEMAKVEYYDLYFMDLQMPVMNGLDATIQIRDMHIKQPHICALTANAMPEDRARCLKAGMDDYLSKPVTLADLKQALSRYQEIKRTERGLGLGS
ncbi:MAG: response regulator [Rhodothermales bacterium]|nr:response regulator [Rhodothermales bacterium]MBO6778310.1 response regulator [Rhodothermales bacterium]